MREGQQGRVVVTGASGFVGGHLACLLAKRGYAVVAPLRRPTSADRLLAAGVEVIPDSASALNGNVHAVVHAAATSPIQGTSAARLVNDNIDLSRTLIELAERSRVKCFVFLSSMSVYGEISAPCVEEEMPAVNPDLYGMTKRIGELLLEQCSGTMSGLSIRLPAVLGSGAARHWLAETARRLVAHQDVTVFHPLAPFNNAIHVKDLAEFIAHIIERSAGGYDVINVASDGHLAVSDAVAILQRAVASRSKIIEVPARKPSFTVSIARANKRFEFRPMMISDSLRQFGLEVAEFARESSAMRNLLLPEEP